MPENPAPASPPHLSPSAEPSRAPVAATGPIPDLVVVGGGLVGLATAREAARLGAVVEVLDRGRPGDGASGAAAGMLSPLAESPVDGPFLDFALASLALWPAWVLELEEETGLDLQYQEAGKLLLARDAAGADELQARMGWALQRGLGARWLRDEALAREAPGLSTEHLSAGALLLEDDYRLDNRAAVRALHGSAKAAGVQVRTGTEVTGVIMDGGACTGVRTTDGIRRAGRVLLAAGAWTGGLEGLPFPLPIRPIRGQMLALEAPELAGGRTLEAGEIYLVPRADGRVLCGATVEPDAGFSARPDAGGLLHVLAQSLQLLPELAGAPLVETWAGLRPGTPDGLPLLGPLGDPAGPWVAGGHFRNGVLLSPATARVVAPALLAAGSPGEGVGPIPQAFSPARFAP